MAKTKVAILGGGLGSMAAAYELSCTQALRDRYELTVYQQGHRLGGKGASGRNAALGERIEEHGLHAFLGFYENAFRLMRDVYDDYAKIRPTARWTSYRDAFEPQRQVTIEEWVPKRGTSSETEGHYATWNIEMPWLPGEPGDGERVPLVEKLVLGGVQLLVSFLAELLRKEPRAFAELAKDLLLLQPAILRDVLEGDLPGVLDAITRVLAAFEEDSSLDDDIRRLVLAISLGAAILRGLVTEVLPRGEVEGFAYIDQWDFKTWLERHGASHRVAFWGPVRALYDLGFAYVEGIGDREHAQAAAGVCLRILLLLGLGYKDAPLWKMKAGMGDVIFAPMYEVL
ncbi:MAG: NAD(P)-binding protein, partial [Myxococcales bacterium]|nr:NAD(P)-binding protein [Myxococcales bacterium]